MWVEELERLSSIAITQPHAAFAAFIHGLTSKWMYLARTTPNINVLIKPKEETIRKVFLPNLTGQNPFNDIERDLLALPARLGGLGIFDPCKKSVLQYSMCETILAPLVHQILDQSETFTLEVDEAQSRMRNNAQNFHRQHEARAAEDLKQPSCRGPSLYVLRKEPPVGSQLYPSQNMGLPYTREPSGMSFVCDTVGNLYICPPTVSAARIFQLSMHLAAEGVDSPLFVTIKFVTSLQI